MSRPYERRRSKLSGGAHPADHTTAWQAAEQPETTTSRQVPVTPATEPLARAEAPRTQPRSKKVTINIAVDLDEEVKDAYWQVRDNYRTFSDFVAEALSEKIAQVKSTSGLEVLPPRPPGGLPTGRPLTPPPADRGRET